MGGGGLVGGIAAWFAGRTRIAALEPEGAPTLHAALAAGAGSLGAAAAAVAAGAASRVGLVLVDDLDDPAAVPFTMGFVDRVIRPDSPAVAAHQLAVLVNATVLVRVLHAHLPDQAPAAPVADAPAVPWLVSAVHLAFLAGVVLLAHRPVLFLGLFLFFLRL